MTDSLGQDKQELDTHPTRRRHVKSLQYRLVVLMLIISIPLIIAITGLITAQARYNLSQMANRNLSTGNASISQAMTLWLDYNSKALNTFVSNPDAASMNADDQKPLLNEFAKTYPYMTLISTVGVDGVTVVRSDDKPIDRVADRYWFQNALRGAFITYETRLVPGEKRPIQVVSMPILAADGSVVGVGMFSIGLDQVFEWVEGVSLGHGGSALLIDQRNIMVAHSNPRAMLLANMSSHPAVKALRSGTTGAFGFRDNKGEKVRAFLSRLPNDWGVIVLQNEKDLYEPIRQLQELTAGILVIGLALMTLLIKSTIRRAFIPMVDLMETAAAISHGDLSRRAREESDDELGLLARSINQMTRQLRDSITNLEMRVLERTKDLERRINHLKTAADVARSAATIHKTEELLENVAEMIASRFTFDHTGIFLIEKARGVDSGDPGGTQPGFAVLRAASSEGGRNMLKRVHRLQIGREGIVGYVAATGKPRIALDVDSDAVFFDNPDLPLTRSEAALPLIVQNKVIGVLDVQSNQPSAFSEEDISTLQILADQLALAIENARLFSEVQQAVLELEAQYGMQIYKGWRRTTGAKPLTYLLDKGGNIHANADSPVETSSGQDVMAKQAKETSVPILLRGRQIGQLRLQRVGDMAGWSDDEKGLIRTAAEQLALSIENARLMEEIHSRARKENQINQIIARTQSALNVESVMETAVEEIGKSLRAAKVQILLGGRSVDQKDMNFNPHLAGAQQTGSKSSGNGGNNSASAKEDRL